MAQTARYRSHPAAIVALALAAASAPSHAQSFLAASFDKSEAILGEPSHFAAIIAAQASGAHIQAVAASLPLSYAIAHPAPWIAPVTVFEPHSDLAASPTRPDIFNSVAIPIGRTPFDGRWHRATSAGVTGSAARFATALRNRDEFARLDAVNAYVNSRVAFTDDVRQFGATDRWSSASDTLAHGRGDCEDYALAKLAMLRRAGIDDRNLYFVVLKDLVRRADHAVLVVRSGGRFLVLDNGTDRLLDSAEVRRICASDNQIRSLMAAPPRAAIESTDHHLSKQFNGS